MQLVWGHRKACHRSYRHYLEKKYYDIHKNVEEALANVPAIMRKEDWKFLGMWNSIYWKVWAAIF